MNKIVWSGPRLPYHCRDPGNRIVTGYQEVKGININISTTMASQKSDTTMEPSDTTMAPSDMIEDPVQSMFTRYQRRFIQNGSKRITYPREYKLAAIKQVKAGNTRYRVAKDLNIIESMLGKWVIKD